MAAVHQGEVVETIIREARLAFGRDPYASEHLAKTAHMRVDPLPAEESPAHVKDGLRLSAMTVVANSRRLAGDWPVHPQMCQVWRDLLAAVKLEALKEAHLDEMRDYLVRHWASPAPRAPFRAEA